MATAVISSYACRRDRAHSPGASSPATGPTAAPSACIPTRSDAASAALDRPDSGPTAIVGRRNRMTAAVAPLLGRRRMTEMVGRLMTADR